MARRGKRSERGGTTIIRREERTGEPHHGGAWKVAYADFVTAMMAFFLVMWLNNENLVNPRFGAATAFAELFAIRRKAGQPAAPRST